MRYDIVGDIHGYADRLEALLSTLGYRQRDGCYTHPDRDRQAVFVGDFIDRGPAIRETLGIVRSMVESGNALSVMGNHEYNAICFNTERKNRTSSWLRSRNNRHIYQHIETLCQFRDHREEWESHLKWFMTLPLYLDLGGIRVVHASWDPPSIRTFQNYSQSGMQLSEELLERSVTAGTKEFDAVQNVLKGIEMDLPGTATIVDKDGFTRKEMRVRWWEPARGKSLRDVIFPYYDSIAETPIPESVAARVPGYGDRIPVFFGHYWFRAEKPSALTPTVACLDYSVASGGFLAAYSWAGERELVADHFYRAG